MLLKRCLKRAHSTFNTVEIRKRLMSPTYDRFQTFKDPVVLKSASGQYCYGDTGKQYLDLLAHNLTISVGHQHPKVIKAAKEQIDTMPHSSTMYYTETVSRLTDCLMERFKPRQDGEAWKVLYAVTGTEAIELALQMARVTTGNLPILSLSNSYHGSYGTAMAVSGGVACRHDLPECGSIHHLQSPINDWKDKTDKLIELAGMTIDSTTAGLVGAFLFEPIQGYGGIHVLPKEYLERMSRLTRERGGLVIADEIQTGYGRMGECYWGYEMSGIEPDIIVLAKGLGNGFPISAVVARESVFDTFYKTGKFVFSTYGGNPVSAAAAHQVLLSVEEESIQDRAQKLGIVVDRILNSMLKYPGCLEVRGKGLMQGIELEPELAGMVFESMKEKGFLMGLGGPEKNVLRVMPPMCITEEDLYHFQDQFSKTIEESM